MINTKNINKNKMGLTPDQKEKRKLQNSKRRA